MEIAQKYSGILKTVWMTAFYAPLLPIGPLISLLGFIFNYWMEKVFFFSLLNRKVCNSIKFNEKKYLLLRRYARPFLLGSDLNFKMIELLEYFPLFFAVIIYFKIFEIDLF